MSRCTWGSNFYEVREKVLMEYVPDEISALFTYIEDKHVDFDEWAKSSLNDDISYFEGSWEGEDDDMLDVFDKISELYCAVTERMSKETNIEMSLFVPVSEILSGENRTYWIADNFFIPNDLIDSSVARKLMFQDVVQAG